jgi:hypothetical protein
MDSIIWMDNDVIIQPCSIGGMYLSYIGHSGERVNQHIITLDHLSDWLYENGYGKYGNEEEDL